MPGMEDSPTAPEMDDMDDAPKAKQSPKAEEAPKAEKSPKAEEAPKAGKSPKAEDAPEAEEELPEEDDEEEEEEAPETEQDSAAPESPRPSNVPGGENASKAPAAAEQETAAQQGGGLPKSGGGAKLCEADFQRAAQTLDCEVACIKAVNEVESGGSGFFASGRPKILFEAHCFSRLTQRRHDASHPDISSKTWNRALYKGGEKEYDRLEKAMALDREAALQSASWGRFQIMGFNHQKAGFSSVDAYVKANYDSEGKQLEAFVNFLKSSGLDRPLREKRWADFAKGYNGSGYAQNRYDEKLQAAYQRFAGKA